MIEFFRRGKPLDDFIDGMRPELEAIPTPAPTDALRARIIASRAAGVRHILPLPEEKRQRVPGWVGLAVAAAIIVLLIPIGVRRSARVGEGSDVASPGVFGQVAFAQSPRRSDRPKLAPMHATGTRLRPLTLELERRASDSAGRTLGVGHISLQVSAASLGNVAAWRVVSVGRDALPRPHVDVETVYVSKADLRLVRRHIHVSPYSRFQRINVWQQFSGDSVTGRMTTDGPSIGAGRAFARQLPRAFAPFMSESVAPVFLMSMPLDREWRGSATLLGWAVRDDDVLLPIELRVEAEETITVPAGRFDCWRLSLRFSGKQIDYWVRKSDGLGVRVLDKTNTKTRETRELVLRRIE
ncbi:MAG: hypothetical protein ACJ794_00060 [Gemmatimonadaceae bacterium]